MSRCVFRGCLWNRGRGGLRTSGRVHGGGEALSSATAAQASSSQIRGAIFRMSLVFPHRSRPFAATFQSRFNIRTEGKHLLLTISIHLRSLFFIVFLSFHVYFCFSHSPAKLSHLIFLTSCRTTICLCCPNNNSSSNRTRAVTTAIL